MKLRPILVHGDWIPRLATRSDGKALLLVFWPGAGWTWQKHETWPRLRKPRATPPDSAMVATPTRALAAAPTTSPR